MCKTFATNGRRDETEGHTARRPSAFYGASLNNLFFITKLT